MTARRTRTRAPKDGTAQTIDRPIDEVSQDPPSEEPTLPVVKQRNKNALFNTELILEAAKPQFGATDYAHLASLCGYEDAPNLRTRISQLVNTKRLDEKFRPPVTKKGKKS